MNYHDFDDNEGCCLKCTEAHPGCLCFDCKCTQCDDYAEGGYNASGEYGGYCIQKIQLVLKIIVVCVFAAVGVFFWALCCYLGGR